MIRDQILAERAGSQEDDEAEYMEYTALMKHVPKDLIPATLLR